MPRFDYVRANTIEQALQLLADPAHISRVLAGGTDVLVLIRHEKPLFDRVIDISRIPEMKVIERRGAGSRAVGGKRSPASFAGEIVIGAAATFTEVAESQLLHEVAAGLVEASLSVGGPAIRNAATLGGNTINAAACADGVPPLICLEAVAHLASMAGPPVSRDDETAAAPRGLGTRSLLVSELVTGANRTAIRTGELLTHFSFLAPPVGARQAFIKLGRRNAQAISRLSMAAAGRLDAHGRVDYVRLVPGAAMPSPRRFVEVESMLLGQAPTDDLLAEAGAKTAETMIGVTGRRWSTEYKEVAIQALAERALRRVLQG